MAYDFSIPNLSCGHCVRAVTEAVKTADPAAEVKADTATRQVQVQSVLPRATLAEALAQAGYAPA
jgi:copper chaperone